MRLLAAAPAKDREVSEASDGIHEIHVPWLLARSPERSRPNEAAKPASKRKTVRAQQYITRRSAMKDGMEMVLEPIRNERSDKADGERAGGKIL